LFLRGALDRFEAALWPAPMDKLGPVAAVDRLAVRVVVGITDTADRRPDARFGQALGVF
jgi:hypothetical protein